MAQLLAIGTDAAVSDDVTVEGGASLTVCLNDAEGPIVGQFAQVHIQLKDGAKYYNTGDELTAAVPSRVIVAAGTYRFSRVAGVSCGVFSA